MLCFSREQSACVAALGQGGRCVDLVFWWNRPLSGGCLNCSVAILKTADSALIADATNSLVSPRKDAPLARDAGNLMNIR